MTPIQRVLEAIEEIKKGHMVIMADDEDRENEGDLVYAATFSTPEHVNFMAKEARGLICVAINNETAKRLALNPMVNSNTSQHETAFTVSVDATKATTGISALERDLTIKILANPISKASELVKPGHIFPLIAKDGGTLVRTGHTEGSIDLCRLAGVAESGVICEIIKDDGTMARRDDLEEFAKKHDLKTVYISDIVEFRLANEMLIECTGVEDIEFFGVKVKKYTYSDHQGQEHTAITFYNIGKSTNVKVHNVTPDIDLLLNKERYDHLIKSIEYLKQNSGVLVFINKQDFSKFSAKEYGIGAQILKALGVEHMKLILTGSAPDLVSLKGYGLDIEECIEIHQ